eukprot:2759553-Ditylum_brightwellii.AAC.1
MKLSTQIKEAMCECANDMWHHGTILAMMAEKMMQIRSIDCFHVAVCNVWMKISLFELNVY